MLDIAVTVLRIVGFVVLFLGVFAILPALTDMYELRRLRRVPLVSIGDAQPGRRAGITGRTAAGPHGMLTSPLTGESCVWYQLYVEDYASHGEIMKWQTTWIRTHGDPFAIAADGRTLLVGDSLMYVPTVRRAEETPPLRSTKAGKDDIARLVDAGHIPPEAASSSHDQRLTELIVRSDVEAFLVGVPRTQDHGLTLARSAGSWHLFATVAPQELIVRRREALVEHLKAMPNVLLLGGVLVGAAQLISLL